MLGLEFECSNLEIKEWSGTKKKKTPIWVHPGRCAATYEVTSEGTPVIEFVTSPLGSAAEILDAAKIMAAKAAEWDRACVESGKGETTFANAQGQTCKLRRAGAVDGMLQVTIGVPLRCLPEVYARFPTFGPESRAHGRWLALKRAALTGAMGPDGLPLSTLCADTWGLLLILMDYVQRGLSPFEKPYAKAVFDTLARTNFTTMLRTLPPAQQARLTDTVDYVLVMREAWVTWIFGHAKGEYPPGPDTVPMFPWLLKAGRMNKSTAIHPTTWLRELPRFDHMSEARHGIFIGLGTFGTKMDDFRGEAAPVFELRAPVAGSLRYEQWPKAASDFWTLYEIVLSLPRVAPVAVPVVPPRPPVPPRLSAEAVTALKEAVRAKELREALSFATREAPEIAAAAECGDGEMVHRWLATIGGYRDQDWADFVEALTVEQRGFISAYLVKQCAPQLLEKLKAVFPPAVLTGGRRVIPLA